MPESPKAGDLSAVRDHTTELIKSAAEADSPVLVEAPPNSGKTTSAIELAAESETPVTYLARRVDLYEQAETLAEEHSGLQYKRIPAPHRTCPTFTGKNSGSASAVQRLYSKGYSGREIHLQFPNKTPCGKSCEYFQAMKQIDEEIDSIDLLIGNHSHCKRRQYIRNRIVIIDEFNPEPFLRPFPNEAHDIIDAPGAIVPEFLNAVAEHDKTFPTETYQDVTDLIQHRDDTTSWSDAVHWFREHGADRFEAQRFDFIEPTADPYNKVHAYAPFLTFALLCMDRVGPGIEVAPPPSGDLDEIWEGVGFTSATKCLRDRNTGAMYALEAPNLSPADQLIGLDGLPTVELWNLLFAPDTGFKHKQVFSRTDFPTYLRSAMNMSLVQLGGGIHPYAGGKISELDKKRLAAVQAIEDEKFGLISTKKALEQYEKWNLLGKFVKPADDIPDQEDGNRVSAEHQALHYSIVKSSNELETESLGVVAGMPFPGDDLVRIWAGFCGQAFEVSETDDKAQRSFGELGNKVYQHFAHNQVVQAVLRFGRDESVYESEGATVYISTYALPDWFNVDAEYNIQSKELAGAVLAKLFEIRQDKDNHNLALRTVTQIYESVREDDRLKEKVSKRGVRNALEQLATYDYVSYKPDQGKYAADLYGWNDGGELLHAADGTTLLRVQDDIHIIQTTSSWEP